MEIEPLTELLGLTNCVVKNYTIRKKEIFLILERTGFPICPDCGQMNFDAPKDRRKQKVEDLSAFGKRCFLEIEKYRIECPCGYSGTEYIEWLTRYERNTNRFQGWIYAFCKRMTVKDVSVIFNISKDLVYRLDKDGIEKELKKQKPINPKKLSMDEISRQKGHRYATIVSAPDEKKILEVVKGRKSVDLDPFFKGKGKKWCNRIEVVSMDAWKAFRSIIKKHCVNASICFDHFHIAQHFSKAIDKLRVQETRNASRKDKEVYRGTRWLLLRNPANLREDHKSSLDRLLDLNKKLFATYILRDSFREIFSGMTAHCRLIRLTNWKKDARSAKIGLISDFLKKIERWEPFIRNSLRHNRSNAYAEGLNNKVRVIQRMAYGYKDFDYLRLKIIQQFNFREVRSVYDSE